MVKGMLLADILIGGVLLESSWFFHCHGRVKTFANWVWQFGIHHRLLSCDKLFSNYTKYDIFEIQTQIIFHHLGIHKTQSLCKQLLLGHQLYSSYTSSQFLNTHKTCSQLCWEGITFHIHQCPKRLRKIPLVPCLDNHPVQDGTLPCKLESYRRTTRNENGSMLLAI